MKGFPVFLAFAAGITAATQGLECMGFLKKGCPLSYPKMLYTFRQEASVVNPNSEQGIRPTHLLSRSS